MVIDLIFFLTFLPVYLIIAFVFLLINAFVIGYFGTENTVGLKDFIDALIWPVSLSIFIGVCLRFIMDNRWKFFKKFGRK